MLKIRRSFAAVALLCLPLAACAGEPAIDISTEPASESESATDGDVSTEPPASTESPSPTTSGSESPSDGDVSTQPAAALLLMGGARADVSGYCSGADGAVIANLADGRAVQLVREDPQPMVRIVDGDLVAESSVDVSQVGETTVYDAFVELEDGPTELSFEVGDTGTLGDC